MNLARTSLAILFRAKVALPSECQAAAVALAVLSLVAGAMAQTGTPAALSPGVIPFSWTDADSGYHVIRLTNEIKSAALDSRRNAFTPDGLDMIYTSPIGIHVLNLATRTTRVIVRGAVGSLAVGTRTRRVFFNRGTDRYLYAVDIDTGATRKIGDLPALSEIMSVNADETLIVGKSLDRVGGNFAEFSLKATQALIAESKVDPSVKVTEDSINERASQMRAAANTPESLFTVAIATGEVSVILKTTSWLGYAQFSPTDPGLMMYTHEGMYYESDRIWTMRSDGSQSLLVHQRTRKDESATREFWSPDGKTIWYEWQKPRGKNYAMVGYDVASGKRTLFKLEKGQASISYNEARGNGMFCGAGHHASSAKDGQNRGGKQSIELLYPVTIDSKVKSDPSLSTLFDFNDEIANTYPDTKYAGWFRRVTLVNLFKNDYTKLQPNVRFSPDNKLVIFTSNILGPSYVFAVEINAN